MTANQRARRAGTVSLEIAIMLPAFVAALFGVTYLHGLGTAAQSAAAAARGCAWAQAIEGCPDQRPELCTQLGVGASADRLAAPQDDAWISAARDGSMSIGGSRFDALAKVPVVGAFAKTLLGEGKRVEVARSAPGYVRSPEVRMAASLYVPCNTVAASWPLELGDIVTSLTH
jgi:hypothetical protein